MGKRRVPLHGKPQGYVEVDPDATVGAILGVNLRLADGRVLSIEEVLNPNAAAATATFWRLIREIPRNLLEVAKLDGDGFTYRDVDGAWRTRKVGREVVAFTYGDATPALLYTAPHPLVVIGVRTLVDVAFDGVAPALTLGTAADPELLQSAAENLPGVAGAYESTPAVALMGGEQLLLSITPGSGATAGAGRIILDTIPLEGI